MVKVRQYFNDDHINNIERTVKEEIISSKVKIERGSSIAIAVGSRGIKNVKKIVKTVVDCVKAMGGGSFYCSRYG